VEGAPATSNPGTLVLTTLVPVLLAGL
jgi:hypothetical protein